MRNLGPKSIPGSREARRLSTLLRLLPVGLGVVDGKGDEPAGPVRGVGPSMVRWSSKNVRWSSRNPPEGVLLWTETLPPEPALGRVDSEAPSRVRSSRYGCFECAGLLDPAAPGESAGRAVPGCVPAGGKSNPQCTQTVEPAGLSLLQEGHVMLKVVHALVGKIMMQAHAASKAYLAG